MQLQPARSRAQRIGHGVLVAIAAASLAMACFLVLPVLQAISASPRADLILTTIDTATLAPPPPVVEPEPEKPEPEEPEPPQLADEAPPLDLAQLELALNPGLGAFEGAGDFVVRIQGLGGGSGPAEQFTLADLDQKPRAVFQQQPAVTAAMRRRFPGTVNLMFTVDPDGRVVDPVVQNSTDSIFEAAALAAIRQWKFEPGKRGGKPVQFRMRLPMTFK